MSQTQSKQQLEESLSALVDGEATELEVHRLLKADAKQYAALRNSWLRYQTASASIKNDVPDIDYSNLASSISAAIDEEPAHTVRASATTETQKAAGKMSIWSGVGRFAVAASVAGAVVLGVQFMPAGVDSQVADTSEQVRPFSAPSNSSFSPGLPSNTQVSTVSNESTVSDKVSISITEDTRKQLNNAEEQVNRLMLEHAQNSAQNTQQGVLPYARVPESQ